ncbi:hypothetical protein [Flavobacterium sp.]|uniref:hypothetical protein n=1 Tax=Flavobacterium sp. TaxID=239 RepID=UPI0025BA3587|nr:hypothetical protein [Flavobacterium sp.]
MKKILLLLLLFINYSFSQIIIADEIDDFTKSHNITVGAFEKQTLSLKDNVSNTKDLSLYFYISYTKEKDNKETQALLFSFWFPKSVCLSQNTSKIMVMLSNNEILEYKSLGKTDCDKSLTAAYLFDDIKPYLENTIKKVRVYTSEGYFDIEIKEEKKEIIQNSFILINSKINQ